MSPIVTLGVRAMTPSEVRGTGTVKYVNLDSPYYGIWVDRDGIYDPINLASAFMVDGLRIRFSAITHPEAWTPHYSQNAIELTSIELLGDVNSDMKVDSTDVFILVMAFGSQPADVEWDSKADLNYDNFINIADAILLAGNYGTQVM